MSLVFQGIKSLGSIVYNTGNTVLRGGKSLAEAVYATPEAVKNGTVAVVSKVVNGTSSVIAAVKNTASSAVNGTVNKAKSAVSGLGNGAVHLLSAGKKIAIATAVQNYAELFFHIHTVGDKIVNDLEAKQPISQVNRNELAERLEEFVELHRLKTEDNDFILSFCKDLRNITILFDEAKLGAMGRLEQILNPYFTQNQRYILSKKAEREHLGKLPGLKTSPSPQLTPEETLVGIQTQVDLLQSNSIKMILGSIVFNSIPGMSTFKGIDFTALGIDCNALGIAPPDGNNTKLINYLIEVSNKLKIKGKSSEEVFQDLMYRVIDNSGKNIFICIHAKMRCKFVYGLVMNLVGNIFDNLKRTLVQFANLPPEKQLEELTKLLINPLIEHLSTVDGSGPVNQAVARTPKTADELLDQFIEAFLAQFIDKKYQPWTRTARAACIENAYNSESIIVKTTYTTLSVLLWIAGKLTAPIHWAINETIHGVLKAVIIDLCPRLSDATKKSLGIGTNNAWYSLKNSLLQLLQQVRLTDLLPRAKDPVYQPPKEIPAEIKEKLTSVLDKLFKVLAIPDKSQTSDESKSTLSTVWSVLKLVANNVIPQDADVAEEELQKFLTTDGKDFITCIQKNTQDKDLTKLKNTIKTALTELILELVTEDGFLNETLLSSLNSINESGFASSKAPVPIEEKQRVEVELQKELGLLGGTILQSVNNATRSDKRCQTAANNHITALKQQAHAFNQKLLQLQKKLDLSFVKHGLKGCEQFNASLEKLEAEITKTVDESTKALLMPHLNQARDHVLAIANNISYCPIEEKRKQFEAKLNELYPLFAIPLDNQAKIVEVIKELRALDAPFLDVEDLVDDLNRYHQIYLKQLAGSKGQTLPRGAYTKPFLSIIADYKDRANTAAPIAAKAQMKQLKSSKIDATIRSASQLADWANTLQFVKVTTKPGIKDVGMKALYNSPAAKAITSATIQAYGKNLFSFIGDEKNLAGIAQSGMEAFLSKPAIAPKNERQKVGIYPLFQKKLPKARPISPEKIEKLAAKGWEVVNG